MKTTLHRKFIGVLGTLLLFNAFYLKAQISNYVFSQSIGIYQPISGGISLGNSTTTNDEYFVDVANPLGGTTVLGNGLPIGFNFNFNGATYDKFGINTNGWIVLGNGFVNFTGANLTVPISGTLNNVISIFGRDLQAQGGSTLRFETIGSAPNRILVVQWDRYKRANQVSLDSLGFQIRLNEADGSVNLMYGKVQSGSNLTNNQQVGIKGTGALDVALRTSATSWTTTTATTSTTATVNFNSTIFPPSGLTFTWVVPLPCVAPPTAGTAAVSNFPGCAASKIVSLSGSSTGSGITYQWLSSTDSIIWSAVSGANSSSLQVNQTISTYYQAIVTCNGFSDTSNVVVVTGASSANTCYCVTNLHSNPNCQSGTINDITISGTNFSNISSGCASLNGNSYSRYSDTGSYTTTIYQGLSYNFNVTTSGNGSVSIWIDYNQNGVFEASEWTSVATTGTANVPNIATISIPANALIGKTGMRVRYRLTGGANGAGDACLSYASGETEDYLINIDQQVPCIAPPTAGIANSSASGLCPAINFTLQLTGNSLGAGLTFQWQSSPDSLNWSSILGANNSFLTTNANSTTFYRNFLTCSGLSDTSNVVKVVINPPTLCYCTTTLQNNTNCNPAGSINDVFITGTTLNNLGTGCASLSGQSYSSYPAFGNTTASMDIGASYSVNVTVSNANNTISLWIDYNQNGIFEVSEWSQISAAAVAGVPSAFVLTIPVNSTPGQTGMRIRTRQQGAQNGAANACTGFASGETEDYTITLVQQLPCVAPPTAGLLSASDSTVCGGVSFTLSLVGASTGAGLGFGWQSSSDGITWNNITATTTSFFTTTQTQSTYYRSVVNCSGQADTSSAVLVFQNLPIACYCISTANQSTDTDLGNITFGALNNGIALPATQNQSATGTYSDFTNLPAQSYTQNTVYPLSLSQINSANFFTARIAVFIDYNQNGSFLEVGETVFTGSTTNVAGGNTITGTVLIPATAVPGNTRLRVIISEGNNTPTSCLTYQWGETEDYTINIVQQLPCVAPPTAGFTVASDSSVCAATSFTLSLLNATSGSGMSYVWQSSPDSINWSTISGASNYFYTTTQINSTYYRCILTCSSLSDTSQVVWVSQNTILNCYCASGAISPADGDIGNVTFGSLSNGLAIPVLSNVTASGTYTDFTALPAVTYNRNTSYAISISQITANANFAAARVTAFIDYNQNGNFNDAGERVFTGNTSTGVAGNIFTVAGSVIIPATATLGNTRLRVVLSQGTTGPGIQNPCGTFTFGETEDYTINIDQFNGENNVLNSNQSFSAYPNPTSGITTLNYNVNEKSIVKIDLYNLLGEKVYTTSMEAKSAGNYTHQINTQELGLESGIYFINLSSRNYNKTIRLVVH